MCVGRIVSEFERTNSKIDLNEKNKNTCKEEIVETSKKVLESTGGFENDILGVSTKYVNDLFDYIKNLQKKFFQSNLYKILIYTTQPAHLVTALCVLVIAYLMVPGNARQKTSPLWSLIYLGSFSTHFGTQIWMTFVSGLALFFSLSRHTFGSVQQILFPKYFLLNASLSFITLFIFMKMNNAVLMDSADNIIQAFSIALCFMLELVVRLYFSPPLLHLYSVKQKIEKAAGVGMEIGKYNLGPLKDDPEFIKVHSEFRRIHMIIALLNLLCMACTTLHLYYLSHKLCDI